jgi:hypothetical protein
MSTLFVVTVAVGALEALSAVWLNAPEVAGQLLAGAFAVVLLGCAWAMRARRSVLAASVAGVFLLVDLAGVPFYQRGSLGDWIIQGCFAAVAIVGVVAWIGVLRERRARSAAVVGS